MMTYPIEILTKANANKQPDVLATDVGVIGATPAKVDADRPAGGRRIRRDYWEA